MKAIELPINLIVVILIAVIILFSITSLYFSGWTAPAKIVSVETVKNNACRKLSTNCYGDVNLITIDNFDADEDGAVDPGIGIGNQNCGDRNGPDGDPSTPDDPKDNLFMLCKCHYSANENECRSLCDCNGKVQIVKELPPGGPYE